MVAFRTPARTHIPARTSNYYVGRLKDIRLIVIHTGETSEGTTPAEGMGYWFQDARAGGSAHKGADTDSICTYIADGNTAWGAPGANADGLHLELAGRAGQTEAQWEDDDSLRILENAAIAAAEWSIEHNIPVRWLSDSGVSGGYLKGFTTHNQTRLVFKRGTHWDPGPNFPSAYFLGRVKHHRDLLTGSKPPKRPIRPKKQAPVLAVDGMMGKATIMRWQQVMGTPVDGVITASGSTLVREVQRFLNGKRKRGLNGRALVLDGKGISSNERRSTPKTNTQYALQKYLGTYADGVLSHPKSDAVMVLQKRLNAAKTKSKKF